MLPRLLAVLLAAWATSAGADLVPCPRYAEPPERTGHVPAVLRELSGFAASRIHRGIFWAHNDSGNAPALYALRADGVVVATFALRGANPRDPEDVAVGPCKAGATSSCIYLGDIGDNGGRRQSVQILKVEEPARLTDGILVPAILPFRYADGPSDAEALVVDPRTARVFVITKSLISLGTVYRIDDLGGRRGGRAVRVRVLRAPREFDASTTGASAHPTGTRLLLRTYTRVWELRSPRARALEDVLDADPVAVPDVAQPQGEAVSYTRDGRGYLLAGEGVGSPIDRVLCAPLTSRSGRGASGRRARSDRCGPGRTRAAAR
jgi:hypothetical protein